MSDTECPYCDDAGLRIQDFDVAVFDLDGVETRTARVHAASWKRLFDEYPFEPDVLRDNIAYYVRRASDGSKLSRIVLSWVLARSDRARSWSLFAEALESDVADIQGGTTTEGIHLGAMAGTVNLVARGQTALEFREDALWINPCLPTELQGLRMKLLYRGYWLYLDISCDRLILSAPNGWGGPSRIGVRNQVHSFKVGDVLEFDCHVAGGGWRTVTATQRRTKAGARASQADVMTGKSRGAAG